MKTHIEVYDALVTCIRIALATVIHLLLQGKLHAVQISRAA